MNVITFTDARTHLKQTIDEVCSNHEPTVITRQNGEPTVLLSLEDFNSIQETIYLLSTPRNATRLTESIAQLRKGGAKVRNMDFNNGKPTTKEN